MSNCIYLKQKFDKTLYCKNKKCTISFKDCTNCPLKEYKCTIKSGLVYKSPVKSGLKKRTSKLAKMERDRFSLFSDNKDKCYLCGSTYKLTWHEIYRGRNRANSMKYGLCLRLCMKCHEEKQEDKDFNDEWKRKGQAIFEITYPNEDFVKVFGRNYK